MIFMENITDKAFAEKVPATELNRAEIKVWYLPHHGIYHPMKPGKIRVMFDRRAKYRSAESLQYNSSKESCCDW